MKLEQEKEKLKSDELNTGAMFQFDKTHARRQILEAALHRIMRLDDVYEPMEIETWAQSHAGLVWYKP